MDPLDPRHGTEAGYAAHSRAGQKACDPCNTAKLRCDKRRRLLGPALQPVPADVLVILSRYSDRVLERHTGVSVCALHNMRKRGDKARAYPETIARLRSIRVPTDVGTVRRVQALARLGWSCPQIAEAAGVPMTTIARVRDHDGRKHLGRDTLRDAIAQAYAEMSMTVPAWTRWSSRISAQAAAAGWPPPLAWDDDLIDDPSATATGVAVMSLTPVRDRTYDSADHEACARCGVVREAYAGRGDLCQDCRTVTRRDAA